MIGRRGFVRGLASIGGTALIGMRPQRTAAEPPPEKTTLRIALSPSVCQAPQYVAEALLKAEGFTDVRYVKTAIGVDAQAVAAGEVDITLTFVGPVLLRIDAGDPLILLGGGHIGCLEVVGNDRVRAIRDLKGKRVLVYARDNPGHVFVAIAMAHVGFDHRRDLTLVTRPPAEAVRAFEEGHADAMVVTPPVTQELRARKIGHVVVDTTKDRPWSQYFCCMVVGNREFVRKHPIATKRAVRAILKATDLCALEPDRAAQTLVDRGFAQRYDYALQAMKELPYQKWRDYAPEDTVRFYALRLHEAGMIKSSPQKILTQGTDWRILNELKKELKT